MQCKICKKESDTPAFEVFVVQPRSLGTERGVSYSRSTTEYICDPSSHEMITVCNACCLSKANQKIEENSNLKMVTGVFSILAVPIGFIMSIFATGIALKAVGIILAVVGFVLFGFYIKGSKQGKIFKSMSDVDKMEYCRKKLNFVNGVTFGMTTNTTYIPVHQTQFLSPNEISEKYGVPFSITEKLRG